MKKFSSVFNVSKFLPKKGMIEINTNAFILCNKTKKYRMPLSFNKKYYGTNNARLISELSDKARDVSDSNKEKKKNLSHK